MLTTTLKIGLPTVKQLYTCNNKLFIMKDRNMQKVLQSIIEQGQQNQQIDSESSAEKSHRIPFYCGARTDLQLGVA
ncbi:hypothetical protein P4S72_02945 [Vibrio sp. PP-XX7]